MPESTTSARTSTVASVDQRFGIAPSRAPPVGPAKSRRKGRLPARRRRRPVSIGSKAARARSGIGGSGC